MDKETIAVLLLIVFILFSSKIADIYFYITTKETVEGIVVDKYVKRVGKHDKFFVVVQTDDGKRVVFENVDSIAAGKFNSADIQAKLDIGKKYRFTVYGVRLPLFSWFKNIADVEEVKNNAQ